MKFLSEVSKKKVVKIQLIAQPSQNLDLKKRKQDEKKEREKA